MTSATGLFADSLLPETSEDAPAKRAKPIFLQKRGPKWPALFDEARPLKGRVEQAFAPDGPISEAQGFRRRESQIAFADAVVDALEAKRTLIAEAGTGTGKTYAYLIPALLSGARVVISTAGKPLQDQLYLRDIPRLSKALGVYAPVAMLKGRANYVCHYRLEQAKSEEWLPQKDSFRKLAEIVRFAAQSSTGDKGELPFVPEDDPLWPMVTSTRETCLGSEKCPYAQQCFVKAAREKAAGSQIVVVNHHLFLSSVAVRAEAKGQIDGLWPRADLTVIDEAHQLPAIASDFFGTSFSSHQLIEIAESARLLGRGHAPDAADWETIYSKLQRAGYDLRIAVQTVLGLVEGERRSIEEIEALGALEPAMNDAAAALRDLTRALKTAEGRHDELDLLSAYVQEVVEEFESWQPVIREAKEKTEAAEGNEAEEQPEAAPAEEKKPRPKTVRWISLGSTSARFNTTPLSFAEDFRRMREDAGGAWVFTSATLSAGGSFRHFKAELGLSDDAVEHSWPSPFNYWEQGCFYLPEIEAPSNNPQAHAERVVEAAWPLVNAAGGRTFFLCTSLAAVQAAADALRARLEANQSKYPLLVQGDAPRASLIEEFRRLGNAVLVGSMSFWEGVDVQGDALSLVVIDKIPFAPPDDPVTSARCDAIKASGGNPFALQTLPAAIIALKQGAGRLIRSETDRGVLMLCDARVAQKRYGATVMKSLPDFYRTRKISKALEFFLQPERYRAGLYR